MLRCIVKTLDGSSLVLEVNARAKGEECLEKACRLINVVEVDYFGLQYLGLQGEKLWLNTRNGVTSQLFGPPPYSMRLMVKFFVPPHLLLQPASRHQFYLQAKQDFLAKSLSSVSEELLLQAVSAVARCDGYGAAVADDDGDGCQSPQGGSAVQSQETAALEYLALKALAQLEGYGVEWHAAEKATRSDGSTVAGALVAVADHGIALHSDPSVCLYRLEFSSICKATQNTQKKHILEVLHCDEDAACLATLELTMRTPKAAEALYRSITEKHCFYRCDTVRSVVVDQCSVDLKGAILSLLYEGSTWGKDYVFDVRHTSREAYDHARRLLFNAGAVCSTFQTQLNAMAGCPEGAVDTALLHTDEACCVCRNSQPIVQFTPCGHRVCCYSCSSAVDKCPVCRSLVQTRCVASEQ